MVSKKKNAFTMVEMLIVVAVLGILAAALLATIDPFEQMKKARDTTLRNAVVDIFDAVTRYYGTKGVMPWETGGVTSCTLTQAVDLADTGLNACIVGLQDAGELKTNFLTQLGAGNQAKIFMDLSSTDPTSVLACFAPDSKAIRSENNTKYANTANNIAIDATNCPDPTVNTCLWCLE